MIEGDDDDDDDWRWDNDDANDDDDGIEEGLLSCNRIQYRTMVVCTGKRWLMISLC